VSNETSLPSLGASQEYGEYAKFIVCTTAHYLESKAKYDPMAMFLSSKLNPVPYQLYDFSKLIEEYKKNGNIRALIAYETGLGKTILVGMILKELTSPRFSETTRKKRILILTPPAVLIQFQDEMKKRFDLDFEKFDTKKGTFGDMVIASYDTLKRDPWIERLKEQVWDIIIVDEFHKFHSQNLRGDLIKVLTEKTPSLIALTATPHDGRRDRYGFRLNIISKSPMVIRRTKKNALDINNRKLFDQDVREKKEDFEVSNDELAFYDMAEQYARKRFAESGAGPLVAIVIGRAVSSSIRAGLKMLTKRKTRLLNENFSDEDIEAGLFEDLLEKVNHGNELSSDDIERILSARPENREALEAELELITPPINAGQRIVDNEPLDSKGKYLLTLLADKLKGHRKCLIYTGFIATLDYLREILEKEGYEILEISGRVSMADRNGIIERFTENDNLKIIIGTDAMGESLNLQAASVEINYEVPWSPVAYIQRVGRIWRLGQTEKELFIHNFLPQFEVERRVMEVILEKIKRINDDFGEIGLSVFGEELGSIDKLVRTAYSRDIKEQVDRAEEKSISFGQEIMEQIMGSMELPKVVNVEDLQRNNFVNIHDSFTEQDLQKFLEHLKDAGVALGAFSDDKKRKSTYFVLKKDNGSEEWIPIERLSLEDEGIHQAIVTGKSLQSPFDFSFAHSKEMKGTLSVFRFKVGDEIVYEEPVLVTPDGVLTYQGIRDLAPSFTSSYSAINFKPLETYKSESAAIWLDLALNKFYEEANFRQQLFSTETDPFKKDALRAEFKKCLDQKPETCTVEEGEILCTVRFKQSLSEIARMGIEEVEHFGMEKATEYYESLGYTVNDVHTDFYLGYDIECKRANIILRVEVKGLKGSRFPLMTPNEHSKAALYRAGYVLFIVKIWDDGYSLYAVPDPVFNKVDITEISKPVYKVAGFEAFKVEG